LTTGVGIYTVTGSIAVSNHIGFMVAVKIDLTPFPVPRISSDSRPVSLYI